MSTGAWSLIVWAVFLLAAAVYVARYRHRSQRPIAAFLIFVTLFSATAAVLYFLLIWLAAALGLIPALHSVVGAVLFLSLVFVPALLLARWQALKPRWWMPPPP